jgi:aryl-alcohol dehydrogenase-like predicted oxidoreductase
LDIAQASDLPAYQVMQPLYNLYSRTGFESELARLAESAQMGVIVYSALASGFLTGKYTQLEQIHGTARERILAKYFNPRGQRILDALIEVSRQTGATSAQIALTWLLKRPAVTAPIVSATSIEQLDEIIATLSIDLPQRAMETLSRASAED